MSSDTVSVTFHVLFALSMIFLYLILPLDSQTNLLTLKHIHDVKRKSLLMCLSTKDPS